MITFVLRPRDAKWIAEAMLAATVRFSGVGLESSRFRLTHGEPETPGDMLEAVATDRYRVHRIRIVTEGQVRPSAEGDALIHADMLRWIIRNALYFKDGSARVWFEIGEVDVTIAVVRGGDTTDRLELTRPLVTMRGNYPPVEKLFEEAEAAKTFAVDESQGFRIRMEYLNGTEKLARSKHAEAKVRPTESKEPGKPGPLIVEYGNYDGASAMALVQPLISRLDWERD